MTRITAKTQSTTAFTFISIKSNDLEYLSLGEYQTMKKPCYFQPPSHPQKIRVVLHILKGKLISPES